MLAAAAALLSAAEQEVDVVYLKDGSVLRGTIVERQTYPVEGIVLRTGDGLKIPIPMDKIQRITQEVAEGQASGGAAGMGGALIEPVRHRGQPAGFPAVRALRPLPLPRRRRPDRGPAPARGLRRAPALGAFRQPGHRRGHLRAGLFPRRAREQPDLRRGLRRGVAEPGEQPASSPAGATPATASASRAGATGTWAASPALFYDTWWETLYFFGMVELAWGKEFGR